MERAIAVVSDVKDLGELLNGARVDMVRILPSGGRLQLVTELMRAMPEAQRVVREGLFKRVKTPWIKSRFTLSQVKDVAVQRLSESASQPSPLLACEAIPNGYRLVLTSPDGLQLSLTLEQLNGQFADVGVPIEAP